MIKSKKSQDIIFL